MRRGTQARHEQVSMLRASVNTPGRHEHGALVGIVRRYTRLLACCDCSEVVSSLIQYTVAGLLKPCLSAVDKHMVSTHHGRRMRHAGM